MANDELRAALLTVAGVAEAQIDDEAEQPIARLILDGTREASDVERDVDRVMTTHTRPVRKRGGLGRDLGAVLERTEEEAAPRHMQPVPTAPTQGNLTVALEESASGTRLTVTDAAGRTAAVPTGWSDDELQAAAVAAVARISSVDSVAVLSSDTREVEGSRIATVLLQKADGSRHAGAAVVTGSLLYAVATAAAAALEVP